MRIHQLFGPDLKVELGNSTYHMDGERTYDCVCTCGQEFTSYSNDRRCPLSNEDDLELKLVKELKRNELLKKHIVNDTKPTSEL
jgi:hypothetical protein